MRGPINEQAPARVHLELVPHPSGTPPCWGMSVQTSHGVLVVGRIHFRDRNVPLPESQWCTGIEDTASRIVAALDEFESHSR
ncbi:hypothetical protein GQ85_09660 [Rhodococcus rhodochrous]|nr:hypothetical protein GQ85_09660 [Rhodococcus rhodochrous]